MVETITARATDFTDRDFDSWVVELRSRAQVAYPNWTDYNRANFGNIFLELFAHTLDVVSFYQDQQYLETRVVFARLRRSMIALGKNVGFRLPGATRATVDLEFTFADGVARDTDLVYLAHLFAGQEQKRAGRLDAALASYRAALKADPSGQAASIATSHALHLRGDVEGAAEVMERGLAAPRTAVVHRAVCDLGPVDPVLVRPPGQQAGGTDIACSGRRVQRPVRLQR